MDIHIKYEIGCEIWYVNDTATIEHSKVTEVNIRMFTNSPIVRYRTAKCFHDIVEDNAYANRDELIEHICNKG